MIDWTGCLSNCVLTNLELDIRKFKIRDTLGRPLLVGNKADNYDIGVSMDLLVIHSALPHID